MNEGNMSHILCCTAKQFNNSPQTIIAFSQMFGCLVSPTSVQLFDVVCSSISVLLNTLSIKSVLNLDLYVYCFDA